MVRLTTEASAAVTRLKELGFDFQQAAHVLCARTETAAANLLTDDVGPSPASSHAVDTDGSELIAPALSAINDSETRSPGVAEAPAASPESRSEDPPTEGAKFSPRGGIEESKRTD